MSRVQERCSTQFHKTKSVRAVRTTQTSHFLKGGRKMNRLVAICLVAVLSGTSYTSASALVVQNQQYHVWGAYSYSWYDDDHIRHEVGDSYDIAGVVPISGSVLYNDGLYGSSSADLLRVSAGSNAWDLNAYAQGYAEGDWIFSPQIGFNILNLQIDLQNIYNMDGFNVLLEDVTAGSQMCYYAGMAGSWISWEDEHPLVTFSVDPAHQYHMHAYLESTANEDGPWSGSIQATITPEPATLLLLGLGALVNLKRFPRL